MDWQQLVIAILGAGGIGGVAAKISQLTREHREGRAAHEGTAIGQWQAIAEYERARADRHAEELMWLRTWYPRVWAAWRMLADSDDRSFESGPPPHLQQPPDPPPAPGPSA